MSEITRYEIVARNAGSGETMLVCYAARRSFAGLESAIMKRGRDIVRALHLPETARFDIIKRGSSATVKLSPPSPQGVWFIGFTGRTQRDCKSEGEHEFIRAEV